MDLAKIWWRKVIWMYGNTGKISARLDAPKWYFLHRAGIWTEARWNFERNWPDKMMLIFEFSHHIGNVRSWINFKIFEAI